MALSTRRVLRHAALGLLTAALLGATSTQAHAAGPSTAAMQGSEAVAVAPRHGSSLTAMALCSRDVPERGKWVNIAAEPEVFKAIELRDCQSLRECHGDLCRVVHGGGWSMKPTRACEPDCQSINWSDPKAPRDGYIYANYHNALIEQELFAQISVDDPALLYVKLKTDRVLGRDKITHMWFRRA